MSIFGEDIILDEEAFDAAIKDFENLGVRIQQLRNDIEDMLEILKTGFDTPAGAKFINSCENNLFRPLDAQKKVIDHISGSLAESKRAYKTVFREYEALQSAINQVKK